MLFFLLKFVNIVNDERKINVNKKLFVVGAFALTALLVGCGNDATLKNGEEVVAELDGKTITAEDLYAELKEQGGNVTLTNMIDEFILNKEYETDEDAETYADSQLQSYKSSYESYGMNFSDALKQAGYDGEDEFKDSLILDYKKKTATEDYVKNNLKDSEIKDYYDDNIFGDIEVRHILISPNTNDDMTDDEKKEAEKKAKKEAEDIIKKLDDGEKFSDLAKEYSDDEGTASNGGKMTATYGSVVDEFWDAASKLKDKTYTEEPVETEYGYHIIYRIKQNEKPSLDKVRDDVIDDLVKEKMDNDSTLQTRALVELRKKYNLDITDSNLKKDYDESVDAALAAKSSNNTNSAN